MRTAISVALSSSLASTAAAAAASSIWQPALSAPWQIVLDTGIVNTGTIQPSNVTIFDIDMYNNAGSDGNDATTVQALKKQGHKVICYFSAGSYEPDRPDSSKFNKADLGKELVGWPGEYWLNTKSQRVRDIMTARIKNAARLGCDAVDPDNVDAYDNAPNGFDLTAADAVDYTTFLANTAHANGLACGLKNAGEIVPKVLSLMQFAVNEQCVANAECASFKPFTAAKKPVFHIEYPPNFPTVSASEKTKDCNGDAANDADIKEFSTVLKGQYLDGAVHYCNGWNTKTDE